MNLQKFISILCAVSTIILIPSLAKANDLRGNRIIFLDSVNNCGIEVRSIDKEITEYQLLYDSLSNEIVSTQIFPKRKNNMPIRWLASRYWKGHSYRTFHKKEYNIYPRICPVFHIYFINGDGECVESFSFPLNQTPAGIPYRLYKYLLNRYFEILRYSNPQIQITI